MRVSVVQDNPSNFKIHVCVYYLNLDTITIHACRHRDGFLHARDIVAIWKKNQYDMAAVMSPPKKNNGTWSPLGILRFKWDIVTMGTLHPNLCACVYYLNLDTMTIYACLHYLFLDTIIIHECQEENLIFVI